MTEDILPVRDPRGKAGSCGVNAQDVLCSQLLDILLHCLQVGPQLVALQDVLHHHRFITWDEIKGCEAAGRRRDRRRWDTWQKGYRPAVIMALKQDFWSMRGHTM